MATPYQPLDRTKLDQIRELYTTTNLSCRAIAEQLLVSHQGVLDQVEHYSWQRGTPEAQAWRALRPKAWKALCQIVERKSAWAKKEGSLVNYRGILSRELTACDREFGMADRWAQRWTRRIEVDGLVHAPVKFLTFDEYISYCAKAGEVAAVAA